jgi:hypothetical protein
VWPEICSDARTEKCSPIASSRPRRLNSLQRFGFCFGAFLDGVGVADRVGEQLVREIVEWYMRE